MSEVVDPHEPPRPSSVGRLTVGDAWALLRAVSPGGEAGEVRGPDGAAGLRIESDGTWSITPEPDAPARALLDLFLPIRWAARCVVGQLGQSVDGRIATVSGHSHYINGEEDILRLHRLRALVDAVVVGAGTVDADDPRLTVRKAEGPNPVRVVLDPRGRLPTDRHVFRDGAAPTLWVRGPEGADPGDGQNELGRGDGPEGGTIGTERPAPHVRILRLPLRTDGRFEPAVVLDALGDLGHRHVLVEGGGRTVSGFLEADALDRLHLSVAPLILGSGRPGITLPEIGTLDEALRPRVRHFRLGDDLLFDLDLRARSGNRAG